MPLTSHYSYKDVLGEFIAHWQTHEELDEMVLATGVTKEGLEALEAGLALALDRVREAEVGLRGAMGAADGVKRRLQKRLVEFNAAARQWLEGLPEGEMVPRVETFTAAPDKFCRPVREALRLWQVVNEGEAPEGLELPLVLRGGFARADLEGLRAEYEAARLGVEEAEFALGLARARRDALEVRVRRVLVSYNQTVAAQFPGDEVVAGTRPRLFPLPGSTPEAVALTGAWSAEHNAAMLSWEESTEPKVTGYQMRCRAGAVYQRRGSKVLQNFPVGSAGLYMSREPLHTPGGVVSFCLYVLKARGRHKAGNPVTIAAPGGAGAAGGGG